MSGIAGIVLAAGASRRMGRPKALLPFRGVPFVDRVLDLLRGAGADPRIVVLGPDPETIRAGATLDGARVVVNPHHPEGQFSSLQRAIEDLLAGPGGGAIRATIVALVDQPHVPPSVPAALVREFEATGAAVVRPVWRGRGGHPVLLSAETFPLIAGLPRSATLYDVVKEFLPRRRDVPAPDGTVLDDIDTPEDFSRLAPGNGPQEI